MNAPIFGKAFVYGSNVDTDQIYPGRFLDLTDAADLAQHAMEGVDPDFARNCAPGDIIIAGRNFGCGSSREHAVICLKSAGIRALAAESFGRIFYRNAVNLGLPVLICKGLAGRIQRGDAVSMDIHHAVLRRGEEEFPCEPLSDYALEILPAGGIKTLLRRSGA